MTFYWSIYFISVFVLLVGFLIYVFFVNTYLKKILKNIMGFRNKNLEKIPSYHLFRELDAEVNEWAEERKVEIEKLKLLEKYRKEFIGNVSHELKTPIFNIQGYVDTLLDGGLEDKSINREYLQRTEKNVGRMIQIVEDLEAITQLESGELQLKPERFDLTALVKEVFEAQEMKAVKSKITLSFYDAEPKPIFVYADRFRIRQVFNNLIQNSIKYAKENGETKVKFNDTGESVMIEVSDNGIGMSKEHLPRIFERFYRVDNSRSREKGGTGLGLSIVKHIVEAHNQTITVLSAEGVGTTFLFSLKKSH